MAFLQNLKAGWNLGLYSCRFAFEHKALLLLPFLSVLSMIGAVVLLFLAAENVKTDIVWLMIIGGYFICIFISIFFNVVLVKMVNDYLEQRKASLLEAFNVATNRIPAILVWTLVTGSVGILIRLIEALEEKLHIPSILSAILDVGWGAVTYFIIPIICFQGIASPKGLYEQSKYLINKVWGDGVVKIIGASLFVFLFLLPLGLIAASVSHLPPFPYQNIVYWVLGILAALMIAFTNVMAGTLQTMFYKYAQSNTLPADFDKSLIEHVAMVKQ
ncbi:DUF6159 family protein [Candidatus Berkiella aquae]|uniref:Uncharacterized protein n=1 Tax=Candidatus Berkiella aquae TaxID=295108 RepID=A0A0Q9Z0B8_9GAMM|nr:DUF6159 family protein [Candidatus Berkiella aquae]MCS5710401.1 hypothetical protein [Candidatus Berkiella aquae]